MEKKLADVDGRHRRHARCATRASRIDGETEYLTGVNGSAIGKLTDLDFDDGSFEVGGAEVVVDEDTAERHGWKAGSDFTVDVRGRREAAADGRRASTRATR